MTAITEQKYFALRGDGYIKRRGGTEQYRPVGNQNAARINLSEEVITLVSRGNKSGTVAREVVGSTAAVSLELDSQSFANTGLGLKGDVKTIAAGTGNTFDLPALKAGEVFKLPHAKVSNVVAGALVEGTNYQVVGYAGIVKALVDIAATTGCTYDNAAYQALGVFTAPDEEFSYLLHSDRSKRVYELLRLKFTPGQHDLISDQFGRITLEGELLLDESVDTSDLPAEIKELGGYVRLADGS